ncbi:MAG: hypothetical protein N2049_07110 [Anaerolineales bacterium]|nr:hypothetical protein [Anaerolineales bacterium]
MNDKTPRLRKMATWTITVFAAVFAITAAVLWLMYYPISKNGWETIGNIFASGWSIFLADAILCLLIYGAYRFYLNKR